METRIFETESSIVVRDNTVIAGTVIGGVNRGVVGGAIGAGVGAVVGAGSAGLNRKSAKSVNPTVEHSFWHSEFARRSYAMQGLPYVQYGPAYQYGWESYENHLTRANTFDEAEPELRRNWENRRGESKLSWDQARVATRDAWQRVERASRGARRGV